MLEVLRSALSFLVAIGVLVSFHEFGHFWVARRFGVKVLRYAVGFGKPIWQHRGRDGVEYLVGSLPLGGYVKLLDEREGPVAEADLPRAFNRQPVAVRIAVFAAGPAFNFVLAVVFYWVTYMLGVPDLKPLLAAPPSATAAAAAGLAEHDRITALNGEGVQTWSEVRLGVVQAALSGHPVELSVQDAAGHNRQVALPLAHVRVDPQYLFDDLGLSPYEPPLAPVLAEVDASGPAGQAGFKPGDRLLSCNGAPIKSWQEWSTYIAAHPGEALDIEVQRGGQSLHLTVITASVQRDGATIGHVGVGVRRVAADDQLWQDLQVEQRFSPIAAFPQALRETWNMTTLVVRFLYRMVLGDISVKNISGPINIAQTAGYSVSIGLSAFMGFIAFVSLSLGIMNLLPVPILDGGQILYGLVEAVKGSPLSERAQVLGQKVGLTLLVMLMGLAFYNDLARLIG
jgi:regulator of sigma E protease